MQPVTDPDLLAILNGGAPAAGGPVYGPPPKAPAAPTVMQVRDQEIQEEKERRSRLEWEATHNPDGSPKPSAASAQSSEGERNNRAYYERAVRALQTYDDAGLGPRSYVGSAIAAVPYVGEPALRAMPDIVGDSPERQISEQAKRDFATIILRSDSGANAPEAEVERLVRTFFPSAGETDPAVLANYAAARMTALEGIKQKAGRLATDLPTYTLPGSPESDAQADRADGGNDAEQGLTGTVSDDTPSPYDPGGPLNPGPYRGFFGVNSFGELGQGIAQGTGDIVESLGDTLGIVGNPLNQTINWATGTNLSTDMGGSLRDLVGLPQNSNPVASAINQAVTSGLTGAGIARGISNVVSPGLAQLALAEYGRAPAMDALTGGTAAASGEMVRAAGGGPVLQTLATVAGGATPTVVANRGSLASLVPRGGRPPSDFDPSVVAAGQRQRVPIRMADAVPSRRDQTAALETSPRGGPIIQQARAADNARIEERVGEIGGQGDASDPFTLGSKVQGAGNRYIDRTRGEKNVRYRRAEQLAGDARVTPARAIAEVDRQIAELEAQGANNNASLITYLRGLKADLASPNGFSITEFQGLRSGAGKKIRGDQALTVTDADRRLGVVMREFSTDASEQLPEAAASALQDADQFYAQRQDFINGVLRNVMGTRGNPLPAEAAASRLVAMTRGKGDQARFERMWGELAPDERADVQATIAMSLGRKANGDFSPATLIRSLDPRTGINPRTARLIFGEDGVKALNDLRAIAGAKTGAAAQLNNSRSGNMINRAVGGLKTLVTAVIGYSAGGPAGAVAFPVARDFLAKWGEERAARALMNPDFTRWLRNAPDTNNPAALNAYFKRLEIAAAKSPILANDIQGFREAVNDTLTQSPGQLAAAEQEQN